MRATVRLAVAIAIVLATAATSFGLDRIVELDRLRAASRDGVIQLQDSTLQSLVLVPTTGSGPEFYILLIDSRAAVSASYKLEFSSLSYSFSRNHAGLTAIFFTSVEASKSPLARHRFNLTTSQIPCIAYLDPGGGSEIIPQSSSATGQQLAAFVLAKSGVEVGVLVSPPLLTPVQLACIALMVACLSPLIFPAIVNSLQDQKLWCAAAITIYLFVISGGLFSILYEVPLIHPQLGNVFHAQPDWQFAGEGFVVAASYSVPAVAICVIAHWLPRSGGGSSAKLPALAIMAVASCCALGWLSKLHAWKTGR